MRFLVVFKALILPILYDHHITRLKKKLIVLNLLTNFKYLRQIYLRIKKYGLSK